jgi:putative chitinase
MKVQRTIYVGVVEENKDPNKKGRIKVRVQTLYNLIPVEDIPYASPFGSLSGKEFQIPAIGKLVNVLFLSDDIYDPYYIYSENYNINLQNKLNDLSDEDYVRFVALLFDDRTQIFSDNNELTLDHYFNKMTISKCGINLELKDKKQILNLGGKGSDQDAVLGTRFFEWMDKFIDELNSPFSLIGNLGAPVLKPKLQKICAEYKMIRANKIETFLSKHVKVIDNNKVENLERDTIPNQNDMDLIISPDSMSENLMNKINQQTKDACGEISSSLPKGGVGQIPDSEDIPDPSSDTSIFKVVRYKFMEDRTIGKLYINDEFYCDTLEDKVRDLTKDKKVYGETAIPYGVYKLTIGPTGLSKRTAPTGRLPLVNNVPYFEGIRIHRWGTPKDTQGCLLVGELDSSGDRLINYDKVADNITKLCEKYQKKGIRMTIAYTKDLNVDTTTYKNDYSGSEYVQKDNPDTSSSNEASCVKNKPDSSWSSNLEMQDFTVNGENLKFDGDYLITYDQLKYIMPQATKSNLEKFLVPINSTLKQYNIDTPLKISAFISQIATESGNLLYTRELGGSSYFLKYEPGTKIGKNLGNTDKGDGAKYKGRGILQVTGKANYKQASDSLGQDFVNQPELLESPVWATISAGLWWKKREKKLNPFIEQKDIRKISKIVNGKDPANGLSERIEFYNRALKAFEIT